MAAWMPPPTPSTSSNPNWLTTPQLPSLLRQKRHQILRNSLDVDPLNRDSLSKERRATEVERFLRMSNEPQGNDPLAFWQHHERHFPILSVLARRYLAPASSAPRLSERLFSRLQLTTTDARSNDSHTLCQMLIVGTSMTSTANKQCVVYTVNHRRPSRWRLSSGNRIAMVWPNHRQ